MIVADATALILLARIGRLELLKRMCSVKYGSRMKAGFRLTPGLQAAVLREAGEEEG